MSDELKTKIFCGLLALLIWVVFISEGKADPAPLVELCKVFIAGLVGHFSTGNK